MARAAQGARVAARHPTRQPARRPARRDARGPLLLRAGRHPFTRSLERTLAATCGVDARRPATIVLAVSGGADSTSLLIAFAALAARRFALQPRVAHVHHHLRGEADDDAAFVRGLADDLELPCDVINVHPRGRSGNISSAARSLRYAALERLAREHGASYIATAHHADDQFETILMRWCRGAGARALAGMEPRRPMGDEAGSPVLIRPLLSTSKAECESFCRAMGVAWRDDPSNRSPDRARARLRAGVTPVLESMWPGAAARAAASAAELRDLADCVEELLADRFGPRETTRWPRAALATLPPALLAAGLKRAADAMPHAAAVPRARLIEVAAAIRDDVVRPREFAWPGHRVVRVTSKIVAITHDPPNAAIDSPPRRRARRDTARSASHKVSRSAAPGSSTSRSSRKPRA
jgi:tRNA(Ile)-lysidine synthetase-like protein